MKTDLEHAIERAAARYDEAQRNDTGAWSTMRERESAAVQLSDLVVQQMRRARPRA